MNFPDGIADAKDQVREWAEKERPIATRHDVEVALDFLIAIEPEDDLNYEPNLEKAMQHYSAELTTADKIIKTYGQQIAPRTLDAMQKEFYSFSNLPKYRYSAATCIVVRDALSRNWRGINNWQE